MCYVQSFSCFAWYKQLLIQILQAVDNTMEATQYNTIKYNIKLSGDYNVNTASENYMFHCIYEVVV